MMKELRWYDKMQFCALILMAAAMPISWHLGLWAAYLIGLSSVIKIIAQRKIGNPAIGRGPRIQIYALLAYMLILLLSAAFSIDKAEGFHVFFRKGGILIFALSLLLSDTSYIDRRHLKVIAYALVVSMSGVFLYDAGIAVGKVIGGDTWKSATTSYIFDTTHHSYSSLYANVAILAAYWLLQSQWREIRGWHRGLLIASIMMCILFDLIVNSRAGIVTLYGLELACVAHLFITTRSWKATLLALLLTAGYTYGSGKLLPGYTDRVASTISDITSDEPKDARIGINSTAMDAITDHPLLGQSAGDYHNQLVDEYDFGSQYNAHNQYTETLLSTGILGLIPLLVYLLWPVCMVIKRRSRMWFVVLMLCGFVVFNLAFESMLERQMGVLFIGFVYFLIPLILSCEENKFGQSSKS